MIPDPKRKPYQDEGDSDKRRRQEEALDEALKNTFPASDPVSVEQPTTSWCACRSCLLSFKGRDTDPKAPGIIKFFQANEVLRRETGYHTCPLGADVAAAARFLLPGHRHSVVAAHGLVVAERDNKKDFEPCPLQSPAHCLRQVKPEPIRCCHCATPSYFRT